MPSFQRSTDGQFFVDGATGGGGGGIAEAPTNGSLYGRQDAGWAIVPPAGLPTTGGTITGKLTLTPAQQTNPSDAATRAQSVLLTGGTMTGKLTLTPAQQTAANDAVTRGQAFPATVVTGNYAAADTAITSLLTALAAAGFIVNNTTPIP